MQDGPGTLGGIWACGWRGRCFCGHPFPLGWGHSACRAARERCGHTQRGGRVVPNLGWGALLPTPMAEWAMVHLAAMLISLPFGIGLSSRSHLAGMKRVRRVVPRQHRASGVGGVCCGWAAGQVPRLLWVGVALLAEWPGVMVLARCA